MRLSRRYFLGGLAALVPIGVLGKVVGPETREVSGIRPWVPVTPAQQRFADELIAGTLVQGHFHAHANERLGTRFKVLCWA